MPEFSAPLGAGSPQSVMDYANQQQQLNDISNQRGIQTAGAVNDLQAKQRSMQLSMLSGVLNEPDPKKQRDLISKLVPIANKMNPSYQIDANMDVPTIRALVQSQITPTEQATLANQRQLFGVKASSIQKDPITGNLIRVNKFTGESTPVTPQEAAIEQAGGDTGGGIFPMPQQTPQSGGQPTELQQPPQPPAFGFPPSNNPKEITKDLGLTKVWQTSDQANRPLFQNLQDKIAQMRGNIDKIGGGSDLSNLGIMGEQLYGGDSAKAAKEFDAQAQDLANMASKLDPAKAGSRGSVLSLQTTLNSKPSSKNYASNNKDLLDEVQAKVSRADADSALYNAFIEANPRGTLTNEANRLADALDKKFPLITTDKNGMKHYSQENFDNWKAAIPDAIQNPNDYLGKQNAATQAGLKQPDNKPTVAPPGDTPIVKDQASFDALPSGSVYVEIENGKPVKYRKP